MEQEFKQHNQNEMCDLLNHRHLYDILKSFKPSNIIHYAEQPSAPYSMMGK